MRKITVLLLISFNSLTAQQWEWMFAPEINENPDFGFMWPTLTHTDFEGNIYINCVWGHNGVTFGDEVFTGTSFNGRNSFVKFDSDGNILWVKDNGPYNSISTISAVTDGTGNIYSTGEFTGNAAYDEYTLSTDAVYNSFISKMDSDGNMQWVKQISIEGNTENNDAYINRMIRTYDIAVDPSGNIYICGQMRGTVGVFDDLNVPVIGETDTFIAKYDNNGNILWVQTAIQSGYQGHRRLVCDNLGNVYMAGSHAGDSTISFGNTTLGGGTSLTFVVKYNPEGEILWLQSHGGSISDYIFCNSIAIDENNNIYTVGFFDYAAIAVGDFEMTTPTGQHQGFVIKYNSDGIVQWARPSGAYDAARDVEAGKNGDVYITGNFWSPQIVFGTTTLLNEGYANGYIAKLDENGNSVWVEHIGGTNNHSQWYMAVDKQSNSLYVLGNYSNIRLGNISYNSTVPHNLFLAKYFMTPLATSNFNSSEVKLYPNPAKETLSIAGIGGTQYSIIDITGRSIKNGQMINNSINVSALPSGIYFLNINNTTTKFIKE